MKRILYIDNEAQQRAIIKDLINSIKGEKFNFYAPEGMKRDDLIFETKKILQTNNFIFDLIILDISYLGDRIGGLILFDEIERDFPNRWKNVIIFTKIQRESDDSKPKEEVSKFITARNIDFKNYLDGESALIKRIKKIFNL